MKASLSVFAVVALLSGLTGVAQAAEVSDFYGDYRRLSGNDDVWCPAHMRIAKSLPEQPHFSAAEVDVYSVQDEKTDSVGDGLYFGNINQGPETIGAPKDEHGIQLIHVYESKLTDRSLIKISKTIEKFGFLRKTHKSVETLTLDSSGNGLTLQVNKKEPVLCVYSRE